MITFLYTDTGGQVTLEVRSRGEHIERVLDDFKTFLMHIGYHQDNIDAVTYDKGEERQALPVQLELPL